MSATPGDAIALIPGYVRFAEALALGVPPDDPATDADERDHATLERALRTLPAAAASALVIALLRAAPDTRLDVYAAGPLEDLIRHRGADVVADLEAEAARDERFRWALGCIWLDEGDVAPEVLARYVRASDGQIRSLSRPSRDPAGGAT